MTANVKLDGIADYLEARFSRATIDPKFREVLAALRSPAQGMYSVEDITGWTDSLSGKTPSAWIDDPIVGIAAWKAAQIAGKEKQT